MTRIEKYLFAAAILTTGFSVAWQFRRDPASLVHEMDLATTTDSMVYRPSAPPAAEPAVPVAALGTLPDDEASEGVPASEVTQIPTIERTTSPPTLPERFDAERVVRPSNRNAEDKQDAASGVRPIRSSTLDADGAPSAALESDGRESNSQQETQAAKVGAGNSGAAIDSTSPEAGTAAAGDSGNASEHESSEAEAIRSAPPSDESSDVDETGGETPNSEEPTGETAAAEETGKGKEVDSQVANENRLSNEAPADDMPADDELVDDDPKDDGRTLDGHPDDGNATATDDEAGTPQNVEARENNVKSNFAERVDKKSESTTVANQETPASARAVSQQPQESGASTIEQVAEAAAGNREPAARAADNQNQPVETAEPEKIGAEREAFRTGNSASEPVTSAPSPAARTTKWKIRDGDTLDSIAYRLFGNRRLWRRIYLANREKLSDPRLLPIGLEIDIPAIQNQHDDAPRPSDRPRAQPTRTSEVGALPMISLPPMPVLQDR